MSRFEVSHVNGNGDGGGHGGIDNPALQTDRNDPVELNVYGLYTKRSSITCPPLNGNVEMKRKSSYGFTHLTR